MKAIKRLNVGLQTVPCLEKNKVVAFYRIICTCRIIEPSLWHLQECGPFLLFDLLSRLYFKIYPMIQNFYETAQVEVVKNTVCHESVLQNAFACL